MGTYIENKKNTYNNFLFYLALGIYMFITIIDSSFFCNLYSDSLVKTCMLLTIFLIIIKEITIKKITYKEIMYLIICMILTIILFFHMNRITILPVFFLIYSARNIELEKILKFIEFFSLLLLLIIIISAKLNVILNYVTYDSNRVREYLGFRYALFPQMYIFNISAISLYRHRENVNVLNIIFLISINYYIYKSTSSRLSFYLFIVLLVGYLLFNSKKIFNYINNKKIIKRILILSYILTASISFFTTIKFNPSNSLLSNLNTSLEGRLSLGKNAIDKYGIKLLGNDINFHGNGLGRDGIKQMNHYDYVDCLYISVALRYGFIFLISYLIIHTIALSNIEKKNDLFLLFILFVIALHGMIDDLQLEIYYNSFWFAIGNNLFCKKIKNGENIYENKN